MPGISDKMCLEFFAIVRTDLAIFAKWPTRTWMGTLSLLSMPATLYVIFTKVFQLWCWRIVTVLNSIECYLLCIYYMLGNF